MPELLGGAQIVLAADSRRLRAELALAARQVFSFASQASKRLGAAETAMGTLALAARRLFAAFLAFEVLKKIVSLFRAASRVSNEFGDQLAFVSTMLDQRTMPALTRFSAALTEFSAKFGEDTQTLSRGMFDVLSASIDARDAVDFLRVGVESARGGFTDTATTIGALTTLINAYGLAASDVDRVSNILFATVKNGVTTFGELSSQIGQVAAIAASLNVPLEEVGAAIATMTRSGLSTADAVTSLRSILVQILRPTDQFKEAAAELGVQIDAAKLKSSGLTGVLKELSQLGPGDVGSLFRRVEAIRGLAILLPNVADFQRDVNTLQQSGGARTEALNKAMKTNAQLWRQVGQQIANVARESGTLKSTIRGLAEAAKDAVDIVERLSQDVDVLFGTQSQADIDRIGRGIAAMRRAGVNVSITAALIPGSEQRKLAEQFASIDDTVQAARERFARRQRQRASQLQRERMKQRIEQGRAAIALERDLSKEAEGTTKEQDTRIARLRDQLILQNTILSGNTTEAAKVRVVIAANEQLRDIDERRKAALEKIEKLRSRLRLLSEADAKAEAKRIDDAKRRVEERFRAEAAFVDAITRKKLAAIDAEERKRKREEQKRKLTQIRQRVEQAIRAAQERVREEAAQLRDQFLRVLRSQVEPRRVAPTIIGRIPIRFSITSAAPTQSRALQIAGQQLAKQEALKNTTDEILKKILSGLDLSKDMRTLLKQIADALKGGLVR